MEESTPARTSIDNGPQILDRSLELDRSKRRLWSSLPLPPTPLPPPAPLEEVPSVEGPLKIVTRLDTARELEEFGAFNLEIVQQSFRNEEKVRQPNEFYCPVKGCCRRYGYELIIIYIYISIYFFVNSPLGDIALLYFEGCRCLSGRAPTWLFTFFAAWRL